ncbi:PREDICTED: glutamate-rich protein 3 [Ceratotherium simum simum]|uniref:Glutamate-rich protein 3 n=1 Tax=Ceratotherium simum simum TaxID=73337 RepID=A0ABM0HQ34_CERSS|nr:PREDICTED: glutamate-rich protein 3 [Ceratotherium simum simum]
MSYSHPTGLLAAYNSLTDKHLAGYFNNTRIRRHLLRSGLITRSGRILSEKEYKLNIMKRDHQKYIRECLAQAIFHKVLDMERYHQLEIKKKLETLARKERIQRFKGEPTRWSIESNMPILSPRPPLGPKTSRGHSVLVDEGHCSPIALTVPRPYTAPGNMQPPIRLQPLPSNPAVGTVPKITSGSRSKASLLENEAPFPIGGKKAVMKFRNSMDNSQGMNRYQFPNINNYMMPIPPSPPPTKGKITRENRPETWRRRRFRPVTAPNGLEPLFTKDSRRIHKTPLHSNAAITMIYLGKNVHLSYDHPDFRDEIKVYQQHCGGENLCVYKGKLREKETFQFISKRHHGFPFSLTFFLNGMQVNRLSSCCEYKHRKGSRLGGKRGYFGFVRVERSSPCYKCIIAMGLDKKPVSPKPRKEKSIEKREDLKKAEGKLRKDREYLIPRRNEMEGSKTSASVISSAQEEKPGFREVRTAVEEMELRGKPGQDVWEDDQENIFKYEYEEDFEADEEKQDEKANEEGRADDQMNGMSKSPWDDEKDNSDPGKESETLWQEAPDADDNVKDEGAGRSESESEEDKQDVKTASSASSRSQPYSSCSEDESALGDREAHSENSPNESASSSSSQELSENDEPGKSHLPIVDSLEIETEDQKRIKADVETKLLPIEEGLENVLEEETEEGTPVIAEGLSEKSREHVSKEEREKDKSELWEGSTVKVKDKKAGALRVEQGVGQIIAEAVEPGCHCHKGTESGVSSADEGETYSRKPENDTGAAPNLMMEESPALYSNKESKQVDSEMYTLQKKEAVEEDVVPQRRDADAIEEEGDAALWEKAGVDEVPLDRWKPTAEQSALVEQFTEEREVPQGIASGAGAAVDGDRRLNKEGLNSMGKEAARDSGGLQEDEAPKEQMKTVLETEKAAPEEEQGLEKSLLPSKAAALNLEHVQETAVLREAVMPEKREAKRGEAMSEAGPKKPDVEESEEEAFTDLEGPMKDAVSEREDRSEEAILRGEEPVRERKAVMGVETPLSSPTSEKAQATWMGVLEDSLEDLSKEDADGKEVETVAESNREDDRKEMFPEELDAATERRKAERPETPLGETESEREEVTRANTLQDEDTLSEEQKCKGEERETVREGRPEEETQAPQNEMECDAEDEAPVGASELTEHAGPQGEDSLREGGVTMFEAAAGFEKSLEDTAALRKEGGGERLREAGDTEREGKAELLGRENMAPSEQDKGPGPEGEGVLGAPESELAGQAQALEARITGKAGECAAKDQGGLAGWEGRENKEPLQGPEGVGVMTMTKEDVPEGDAVMAGKLGEEAMDEEPEEEVHKECTLGVGVTRNGDTEGDRSLLGGVVVAEEDLHQGGGAAEKREVLEDSKTPEGKREAEKAASFSDVADEETWHRVDELQGKMAAAEKVVAEETKLSGEEVPVVEEVPVTWRLEAGAGTVGAPSDLEGKTPQPGQDQEDGAAETTQRAESAGEEPRVGSHAGGQEWGAAEEFRLGLSQDREPELRRGSLPDMETLPVKHDCTGTQEKQERAVQRESKNADVSPNNTRA